MPIRAFDQIADALTAALIAGDFAAYRSLMQLPLKISSRAGQSYSLQTEDALRQDFDAYVAVIRAYGVTDIYRQIVSFDVSKADQMQLHCLTHIMADAQRLVAPFETHFHLHHSGDGWRISFIESSEDHIRWTLGQAPLAGEPKAGA